MITEIPDDLKDLADEWHSNLVEKICELDDDLLEKYLEGVLINAIRGTLYVSA